MDTIKTGLFYSRDFLARNFMVSPKALIYKKELIYFSGIKNLLYLMFKLLPFGFVRILLSLINIGVIYKLDSIYNMTKVQQNHIIPIILAFLFVKDKDDNENSEEFTSHIKYYNACIPLNFIIDENNLVDYKKIKIKYLNKGKMIDKILDISNFINLPIYKLFEN
jgi:hypothetical protein